MEGVRVALAGAGYWGKNLLRNFHALGVLGGVYDPSPETVDLRRREFPDVRFENSLETVLADPSVNAVAVAVPVALHYEVGMKVLQAGKHLFMEKPLALEVGQGEHLVRTAQERGLVLMTGHILQYHPAVRCLINIVRSGQEGRLLFVSSVRKNFGKIRREENALWSLAPHDFSVILALAAEDPVKVWGRGESLLQKGVEDIYRVDAEFPSGLRIHVDVSWLHPVKEQKLVVLCERAMFVFDDTRPEDKLVRFPMAVERRPDGRLEALQSKGEPIAVQMSEPLRNECEHFVECVRTGKRPLTDGEEGLRVLRFLRAASEDRG